MDSATAPELTPAELASAAERLRTVAACPIAKMPHTDMRPDLYARPSAPGYHHVVSVTDDHRVLLDAQLPDAMLDPRTVDAMRLTRDRKSAEFRAACARCGACQRYVPAPITRGPLTLTR